MRSRRLFALFALAVAAAACSGDDVGSSTSSSASIGGGNATTVLTDPDMAVVAGEEFPAARCAANEAAGTVTFLTGFDYAAAASIIDVIAADAAGYYEDLCLDVEIRPSFSSSNYALVAEGNAQFASGGSFSEVVANGAANNVDFVAATVDGRSAIDTLIVKSGEAAELGELDGSTLGVKAKLPPSIDVMLRGEGLVEGEHYDTVLLDGFDPIAHMSIPTIDGLPGWKSNEVGALERAGVGFQQFDPLDFGVPGSFGVIFTTAEFVEANPAAAQDFIRATVKGLEDAVADPDAAATTAVDVLTANDNPNALSPETEAFRWATEAALILDGTPEGHGLAVPDVEALQTEVDAYAEVGFFGETPSSAADFVSPLASNVYDGSVLIWPA